MFGVKLDTVTDAEVPFVVLNCFQVEPLSILYCQTSHCTLEVAETLKLFVVILDTEQETVGAVLSILLSATVFEPECNGVRSKLHGICCVQGWLD